METSEKQSTISIEGQSKGVRSIPCISQRHADGYCRSTQEVGSKTHTRTPINRYVPNLRQHTTVTDVISFVQIKNRVLITTVSAGDCSVRYIPQRWLLLLALWREHQHLSLLVPRWIYISH